MTRSVNVVGKKSWIEALSRVVLHEHEAFRTHDISAVVLFAGGTGVMMPFK